MPYGGLHEGWKDERLTSKRGLKPGELKKVFIGRRRAHWKAPNKCTSLCVTSAEMCVRVRLTGSVPF